MENLNIKFLDGYCLKFDIDYWKNCKICKSQMRIDNYLTLIINTIFL